MAPSLLELPAPLAGSPLAGAKARRWVRWAVVALAALAVGSLFAIGGSRPADPFLATSRVQGFDEGTLKVVAPAQGSTSPVAAYCSLLASSAAQHARGLMTRRDLGGYGAMVFGWPEDVDVLFYNRNVPMALTVAWFDREGRWIGSRDLEPCPDVDGCPTIAAPVPFRYVVEVEKGGLSRLGLGPGSQIAVTSGCEAR
jgi:uncharacterized membrane protein (UPF0127 family)